MDVTDPPAKQADAFSERAGYWRRVFARGVGRSPTSIMKSAIDLAAKARAEVDRVYENPYSTSNDRTRAMHSYRLARADMEVVLADARPPSHDPSPQET